MGLETCRPPGFQPGATLRCDPWKQIAKKLMRAKAKHSCTDSAALYHEEHLYLYATLTSNRPQLGG